MMGSDRQLKSSFGLEDDHSRVACCRFWLEWQLNSPCCIYVRTSIIVGNEYLHGHSSKKETDRDTSNGSHRNIKPSQCWVYNTINDRDENNLCYRISPLKALLERVKQLTNAMGLIFCIMSFGTLPVSMVLA